MPWLGERKDGAVVLSLHVQPGARRTALVGIHGERLKIAVAPPPVDGKANKAVLKFLGKLFGCPSGSVSVVAGHGSRQKRVEIATITEAEVRQKIAQQLEKC